MKRWKTAFELIKYSWRPLFRFELLYKLLAVTVFASLFSFLFRLIVEISGYSYLTVDNLTAFLFNPVAVPLLFLLLLCIAFYAVFDIAAILFAIDQASRGRSASVYGMTVFALRASLRVFRPRFWPLAAAALFLLPVLNIGVISGYISTISIPDAIVRFALAHRRLFIPIAAAAAALVVCLLRWLYVFHYCLLENCSFLEACRRSAALSRGRKLRNLAALIVLQAASVLIFAAMIPLVVTVVTLMVKMFVHGAELFAIIASSVWVAICLLFLVGVVLSAPVCYCLISAMYCISRREKGELPAPSAAPPPENRNFRLVETSIFLICCILCSVYAYQVANGSANFNIEYIRTTEVTAHRGASAYYPENTMAAFRGAIDQGADWIELDVQQTRDGRIIVMHDSNLYRTTGLRLNIWDADWAEISQLDAGSWFSPEFAGERIPLLSEVLELARETGTRLNIELKPTGHETDFESSVVRLVEEYGFADRCVVTSQSYSALERVKAANRDIRTVYVMSVAYGDLTLLEAADAFSVNFINITSGMVSRLHDAGKELYAWTVNRTAAMDKMIRLGVDNLVTDNVVLARERIYAGKTSNVIQEYIRFLLRL